MEAAVVDREPFKLRVTVVLAGLIAARTTDPLDTLIAKSISLIRQIDSQVDAIPQATLLARVR